MTDRMERGAEQRTDRRKDRALQPKRRLHCSIDAATR